MRFSSIALAGMMLAVALPASAGVAYKCVRREDSAKKDHNVSFELLVNQDGSVEAMDAWSYNQKRNAEPVAATVKANDAGKMVVTWFVPSQRFGKSDVTDGSYRAEIDKSDNSFALSIRFSGDVYPQFHRGLCTLEKYKG